MSPRSRLNSHALRCRSLRPASGFTLIEIAVTLFILTLVIGALLTPLATQVEERQVREAERVMNEIVEALIGYSLSRTVPYLPCPDLTSGAGSNDGIEDRSGNTCSTYDGNIPWATLGINATDPWGNRYRYLVTQNFSDSTSTPVTLTLATTGNLQVCTSPPTDNTSCAGSTPIALNVAAIIISHGRNGAGAMNGSSDTQIPNTSASTHEIENAGGPQSRSVVSKTRSEVSAEQFDDIVVWLSPNVLFNRLVAANKLP